MHAGAHAAQHRQIVRLGTYSRDTLQALRRDLGIAYDQRTQGILHFYTDAKRVRRVAQARPSRCATSAARQVISADEGRAHRARAAPHPPDARRRHLHATDESGDANKFTPALAARSAAAGVKFLMGHTVTAAARSRRPHRPAWR
jgi:D-amino-acid dehydrogenase